MRLFPSTKGCLIAGIALAGLMSTSILALAVPIAPHPPYSKLARQVQAAQPGKKVKSCPDAATVGIPAYPGSFCVAYTQIGSNGHKDLPLVILVSKADPETVRHWYAEHLSGWQYDPQLHHFVRPGWSLRHFLDEPEVHVVKATDQHLALYRVGFVLKGMHTFYQIRYVPHDGVRR